MDTSILLMVFNRPETARKVFEAIRVARPSRLFVAADGPRPDRPGEDALCSKTRAIVSKVDWPCKVETLFRTENLGCRDAVSSAIDWFFSNVEQGIILEDDVLPSPDFFRFCSELLNRYRDVQEVMMIGGTNPAVGKLHFEASYSFSGYALIWGWATWKRAWKKYDVTLSSWSPDSGMDVLSQFHCASRRFCAMWSNIFNAIKAGRINTWDYQWVYALMHHRGCAILPSANLVENIGFGEDATHSTGAPPSWTKNKNRISLERPLIHPDRIKMNKKLDLAIGNTVFGLTQWAEVKFRVKQLLVRLHLMPG